MEIMEGRMEGKRGRGMPRQKLMNWMMEDGYWKLKERYNIKKSGVIGHLDLPGGRSPKEDQKGFEGADWRGTREVYFME